MSITVKPAAVERAPSFAPKSLVVSKNGERVYLVIGPGDHQHQFAGVRLSGSWFEYGTTLLKSSVKDFEGEVVIKND